LKLSKGITLTKEETTRYKSLSENYTINRNK
jgi:hypothetical protein